MVRTLKLIENLNIKVMKKALLTIAILLFTGLSVDVLAQRKRSDDRKPRKEATLNNKNRGSSKNYSNNRNSQVNNRNRGSNKKYSNANTRGGNKNYSNNRRSKDNRIVRVVDRRVSRNSGWRNYGYSNSGRYDSRRFYDFDSRRGVRILVNRGYRPSQRHIWVAGHWTFSQRYGREVWIDGRWSIRRSNHRWVAGYYQRANGLNIWIDGCWTIRY